MAVKRFTGKTESDAVMNAAMELGIPSTEIQYAVIDKGSNGFLGLFKKPVIIELTEKEKPAEPVKEDKSEKTAEAPAAPEKKQKQEKTQEQKKTACENPKEKVYKRPDNIDQIINDTEAYLDEVLKNYRERRQETLEKLALSIANKVKKTKKPVHLEPMNPNERRIIHSALQRDPKIVTKSQGKDPYRRVVVMLKK